MQGVPKSRSPDDDHLFESHSEQLFYSLIKMSWQFYLNYITDCLFK